MKGFEVQYSDDESEICIIPKPSISTGIFFAVVDYFHKQGYKYWLPADERRGYILAKNLRKDNNH